MLGLTERGKKRLAYGFWRYVPVRSVRPSR